MHDLVWSGKLVYSSHLLQKMMWFAAYCISQRVFTNRISRQFSSVSKGRQDHIGQTRLQEAGPPLVVKICRVLLGMTCIGSSKDTDWTDCSYSRNPIDSIGRFGINRSSQLVVLMQRTNTNPSFPQFHIQLQFRKDACMMKPYYARTKTKAV